MKKIKLKKLNFKKTSITELSSLQMNILKGGFVDPNNPNCSNMMTTTKPKDTYSKDCPSWNCAPPPRMNDNGTVIHESN